MASEFHLNEYLNQGIAGIVKDALKASLKNPKESLFLTKFALNCKYKEKIRASLEEDGKQIPVFLIASIANNCNLYCSGCYARANNSCGSNASNQLLSVSDWIRIFQEAGELGISFILLAGGEPLLRKDVIEAAAVRYDILFPIFTNGTLLDQKYMKLFDNHRNLLPIISLEGDESYTDARRGTGVYQTIMTTMETLGKRGIFFGVSITVTKDNIYHVTEEDFLTDLEEKGCKVVFYVEYVPVSNTNKELVPTDIEREYLEERLRNLRYRYEDMMFLSFPGDEKEMGGCLAAGRGFFHINPSGRAEPCPFSPYSDTDLKEVSLIQALQSPLFQKIQKQHILNQEHVGGCVLFEQEEEIKKLVND